jgi:hypothetical protein
VYAHPEIPDWTKETPSIFGQAFMQALAVLEMKWIFQILIKLRKFDLFSF